jgi:ribosome-associated protein
MKSKPPAMPDALKLCVRVLDEKKAGDLTVLDVSGLSSITDYLVVATATSVPHLRALRVELEKVLDAANTHLVGMETPEESGWMVIDIFDVMVHLFLAETRERYGLERLWRDAAEVPVSKLLAEPKKPAKAPRRRSATPTRRKGPKKA